MGKISQLFVAAALMAATAPMGALAQRTKVHQANVGEFTELRVDDRINVVYSNNPDSVGLARFDIENEKASAYMFKNNGKGALTVQRSTEYADDNTLPTVYVYSSYLQTVKNSSDSTIRIAAMAACPELKMINSGNGKIVAPQVSATKVIAQILTGKGAISVGGRCESGQFKLVGTGEIIADQLECGNVSCTMLGTGTIGCNTAGELSVKGAGSGKVYYVGTPKEIKTSQVGSVKVIQISNQ